MSKPNHAHDSSISFVKMQANGNDFVVADGRYGLPARLYELIPRILDRHYGIGGDGLIVIDASVRAEYKMSYFNADGSRAICGNGIRCAARFIYESGLLADEERGFELETDAGNIPVQVLQRGARVKVAFHEPFFEGLRVPTAEAGEHVDVPIVVDGETHRITAVGMGNPHCVVITENVSEYPVGVVGPKLELHEFFPQRTNVEFVEIVDRRRIKMRVWERGVGETLACGTGACGAVGALIHMGKCANTVVVETLGGELEVSWDVQAKRIHLTGDAARVFSGEINLQVLREAWNEQ
ncbi:MAG: diaminopimelate epimerase [Deltaproteobacteria bacterium]|nr:diaminopimelate epimerase [Deltaproteobacteria bacterium]